VTVWFSGLNWNCTISPTTALMLLGENSFWPALPPTVTTWTVCARALPMLRAEIVSVVNCILKDSRVRFNECSLFVRRRLALEEELLKIADRQ